MSTTPHIPRILSLLLLLLPFAGSLSAQVTAPKYELRAGWLYTVWNLDWPPTTINVNASETVQANQRKQQQQRLIYYLDHLQQTNINTVFFQVRSCADAMYQSSYEPWSGWLVSSRGGDPGWDPLAFIIEEAHKRGIALHAWIDPYRYETTAGMWDGTIDPGYSVTNPDWIYTYNNFNILNPGLPEVRQRVVDVVRDIITRYDVDGIALNDYFYVNNEGKTDDRSIDYDLYLQLRESESQTQDDWRRENVTRMVADVYDACMAEKPYLWVGVSPSGEMCTNKEMADKYDVDVCTSGWDWQYSYIFSEPLEWLRRKKVDYLFPQIYWTIGYEIEDFSVMCPWWQKALNRYGRHNYVKHSLNGLANVPKSPLNAIPQATGPNSSEASEYVNEILLTRTTDWNLAPGQGFFKTSDITNTPRFVEYLVDNAYPTKALPPSAGWKKYPLEGLVGDIHLDGDTLRWNYNDNVRYAIYALSANEATSQPNTRTLFSTPDHLLGMAYSRKMFIPDPLRNESTIFAVSVIDRYGVEHSPRIQGTSITNVAPPDLFYPADGETVSMPFRFSWADNGESLYRFEVAEDKDFESPVWSVPVSSAEFPAVRLQMLEKGKTYYWRIVSYRCNAIESQSPARAFSISTEASRITYPSYGQTDVEPTTTVTWEGGNVADFCRLQIAFNETFNDVFTVINADVTGNSFDIPSGTLNTGRAYFARVIYNVGGIEITSPVNRFVVKNVIPDTPQLLSPLNDDEVLTVDIPFEITPRDGTAVYRMELATSPTFPVRATKLLSFDEPSGIITQAKGSLKVNTTYYLRPSVRYYEDGDLKTSATGDVVKIFYRGENSVDGVVADIAPVSVTYFNLNGIQISEAPASEPYIEVIVFSDGTVRASKRIAAK